jgi:3D (Asp-Asp-Asp) domain-containing protein
MSIYYIGLLALTLAVIQAGATCTFHMSATAYSIHGLTATGIRAHPGVVAADPHLLPAGSKVLVKNAGAYSGVYEVQDTGGDVRGRKIDIYTPSTHDALRFGKREVTVQVLHRAPR